MVVPWARLDEERGGTDSVVDVDEVSSDEAARSARNLGSLEQLAHVQAWSPRGDRDVGEPRRAYAPQDVNGSMYSLRDHPIPGYGLFSEDSLASSFDGHSTTPLRPMTALRQLPSHLIDENLASRAHSEATRYSGSPINLGQGDAARNPYLSGMRPRLMETHGHRHNGPWDQQSVTTHRTMAERLRNLGKQPPEPTWNRLPTPGRGMPKEETEPWAASFKSSLVNAFNAVAAGITSSAAVPTMRDEDDILTARPTRRNRASARGTSDLSWETSSASARSKGWALEEKDDGTGVVHFLSSLEKYDDQSDMAQRPSMHVHTLSFGDGESISTYDERSSSFRQVSTRDVPPTLMPSSTAQEILLRAERNDVNRVTSPESSLSRESSVYSPGTSGEDVGGPPDKTKNLNGPAGVDQDPIDSIVIEPDLIYRISSSDSSVPSIADGLGARAEIAVMSALMDRQGIVSETVS